MERNDNTQIDIQATLIEFLDFAFYSREIPGDRVKNSLATFNLLVISAVLILALADSQTSTNITVGIYNDFSQRLPAEVLDVFTAYVVYTFISLFGTIAFNAIYKRQRNARIASVYGIHRHDDFEDNLSEEKLEEMLMRISDAEQGLLDDAEVIEERVVEQRES